MTLGVVCVLLRAHFFAKCPCQQSFTCSTLGTLQNYLAAVHTLTVDVYTHTHTPLCWATAWLGPTSHVYSPTVTERCNGANQMAMPFQSPMGALLLQTSNPTLGQGSQEIASSSHKHCACTGSSLDTTFSSPEIMPVQNCAQFSLELK